MQLQEGLAEASGEGGSGLDDAALGAGQLCGKAGQDVYKRQGYERSGTPNPAFVEEAAALARKADVVVLCMGLDAVSYTHLAQPAAGL